MADRKKRARSAASAEERPSVGIWRNPLTEKEAPGVGWPVGVRFPRQYGSDGRFAINLSEARRLAAALLRVAARVERLRKVAARSAPKTGAPRG